MIKVLDEKYEIMPVDESDTMKCRDTLTVELDIDELNDEISKYNGN